MRRINRPPCPYPNQLTTNYKYSHNKNVLCQASYGKCMYCESKIIATSFGDIEHIKPKSRYPELKYDWGNLGLVCSKCNSAKRDKFDELTPYINPYDEDPQEHLTAIGCFIKHINNSNRGERTITDIELNRPELLEKRDDKIKILKKCFDLYLAIPKNKKIKPILNELLEEAKEDKEYSLVVEHLIRSYGFIKN